MTPQIYDIECDDYRDVTQDEVDRLVQVARAYCELRLQVLAGLARAERIAQSEPPLE